MGSRQQLRVLGHGRGGCTKNQVLGRLIQAAGCSSSTCSYQGALILLNISNTQDNARHAVFVDEAPESRAGGERESKLNIRYGS